MFWPTDGSIPVIDSGDGSYVSSFCGRFVVDIHLPSSIPSTQALFMTFQDAPSASLCNHLTEYLTLYRLDALSNRFVLIKSAVLKGNWSPIPNFNPTIYTCALTQTAGNPAGSGGNTAGWMVNRDSVVYRVAVAVTVPTLYGTLGLPVTVMADLYN